MKEECEPGPSNLSICIFEISKVVRLRGAVERDRHTREIEAVYGAEGTARIGLTLVGLLAGLDTLGVDCSLALDIVDSIAMDSVPPIRRNAYEFLAALEGGSAETTAVAKALVLPTNTVRRALEDLTAYGMLDRIIQGQGKPDLWTAKQY
jgi:FaeA-like protein